MKDFNYHSSAVFYNEQLAARAYEIAKDQQCPHPEIRKWVMSVAKQHDFHARRHRAALRKLEENEGEVIVENIPDGLDVPDNTSELSDEEVNRLEALTSESQDGVGTEVPSNVEGANK